MYLIPITTYNGEMMTDCIALWQSLETGHHRTSTKTTTGLRNRYPGQEDLPRLETACRLCLPFGTEPPTTVATLGGSEG
jgi:hypothetical protein